MACTTVEELEKDCNNNLGGGDTLLYNDQDELLTVTIDPVTYKVTAVTKNSVFKQLYFKRNAVSYNEEEQIDLDAGSSFVRNTLTVSFKRREAAKSRMLKIAGEGQRELAMFFKDGNGIWWYLQKMQKATNVGGNGQTKAEGSKYDVTFVGEYEVLMYEVASAVITALLTP